MDLAYNRRVATGVLAVCVLGSVFGMGGAALVKDRARVVQVFDAGSDPSMPTRLSIDAYLEKCGDYARVMAEEVRQRVDAGNASAARALELAQTVGDGSDYGRRKAEYEELNNLVEAMYTAANGAGLSDTELQDFTRAYRNYKSEAQKITYDAYHTMAAEYNGEVSGFPAGIVSQVVGAGALETF